MEGIDLSEEGIDLSAIEAKYPLATFSAALINERLGVAKRNGCFVDQYAELTTDADGLGHVTMIAAPDGWTPEIAMILADAQNSFYRGRGIDLTGAMPELKGMFERAAPGDIIETAGHRFEVYGVNLRKMLTPVGKKPGEA